MKKTLNEEVVASIRNALPPTQNILTFLADLFLWNKEAVYRRLRCEIPFTYHEITTIASQLHFSIDTIVKLNQSERVLFDLQLQEASNPIDLYCEKREQLTIISRRISQSEASDSLFALNYVPYSFSIFFDMLSKFDYYKWMHQTQSIKADSCMADVEMPQRLVDMRKAWNTQDRSNSTVSYILDNNVFLSLVKDIDYFYKRNLINEQELEQLKLDLVKLLNQLGEHAELGIAATGAKVYLYLSPVDISTNHSYIEYGDSIFCYVQVYGADILQSYYPEAFTLQKEWMEKYKRYSTLITKSGEMERVSYFEKQQQFVLAMGQQKEDSSNPFV